MHKEITALVSREFEVELVGIDLTGDLDLVESGIVDSMGLSKLAAALEVAYPKVKVPDSDVTPEMLGSVDRIVAYLDRRLKT